MGLKRTWSDGNRALRAWSDRERQTWLGVLDLGADADFDGDTPPFLRGPVAEGAPPARPQLRRSVAEAGLRDVLALRLRPPLGCLSLGERDRQPERGAASPLLGPTQDLIQLVAYFSYVDDPRVQASLRVAPGLDARHRVHPCVGLAPALRRGLRRSTGHPPVERGSPRPPSAPPFARRGPALCVTAPTPEGRR